MGNTRRAEDINKMTRLEIEVNSKIASELFDKFTKDTKDNLGAKEAFILGYLHGIEKTFEEMGMFDSPDDISKTYDFLEKNASRFNKQ